MTTQRGYSWRSFEIELSIRPFDWRLLWNADRTGWYFELGPVGLLIIW